MKEMSNEYTAETVTYENLSILLFMTQKAISDLKLLKSIFYHRKYNSFYSHPYSGGMHHHGSYPGHF